MKGPPAFGVDTVYCSFFELVYFINKACKTGHPGYVPTREAINRALEIFQVALKTP